MKVQDNSKEKQAFLDYLQQEGIPKKEPRVSVCKECIHYDNKDDPCPGINHCEELPLSEGSWAIKTGIPPFHCIHWRMAPAKQYKPPQEPLFTIPSPLEHFETIIYPPPDIHYGMGEFNRNLSSYIIDKTNTNHLWAESITLSLLATALGPTRKIFTGVGPLALNQYTIYIGPSGLANKTTPLIYFARPILKKIRPVKVLDSENISEEESAVLQLKSLELPSKFTVESMTKYLCDKSNEGLVIRDEFTSLIKSVKKAYQSDLIEFLSEIFDGHVAKRYTITHKEQTPENIHISMLSAATTYIFELIDHSFYFQGLGNRILHIFEDKATPDVLTKEDFLKESRTEERERERILMAFAEQLNQFRQKTPNNFEFSSKAGKIMTSYRNQKIDESAYRYNNNPYDIYYSYINRMPLFVLKTAPLACVSHNQEKIINEKELKTLIIEEDDVLWAINKIETHYNHFDKFITKWHTTPPLSRPETDEANLQLLEYNIKELGPIGKTELHGKTSWNWYTFEKYLNSLIEKDRIKIITEDKTSATQGRKIKKRYVLNE